MSGTLRGLYADRITVNGQPEYGNDPLDVTAVESTQVTWDMSDRRFWPALLKLWERPKDWVNPTYEVGVMKYKGRIVLDTHDQPIRDFHLPLTISSVVEGLRIEAWTRADSRISLGDIEARVWTKVVAGKRVPAFDKRVLSKRASNARTRASLISWVKKAHREKQTLLLDDRRTKEQRDRNLAADTDLTAADKAEYALIGLKKSKESKAPTRARRISRLERRAAKGGAVAGPSSGAAAADPAAQASDEEDDDLTDDTDGHDAGQGPQAGDQASDDDTSDEGSVSSSLIEPSDSRNDEPQNAQEEALLRNALEPTIQEFRFLTGQEPVLTHPGDNYLSQWAMLQEQFRLVWAAAGNTDEAPRLTSVNRWTGGVAQYGVAELAEAEQAEDSEVEVEMAEDSEVEAEQEEDSEEEAWDPEAQEAEAWGVKDWAEARGGR